MNPQPQPPSPPLAPPLDPPVVRSALRSLLARGVALVAAFAVGWLAVDRGLGLWVEKEARIAQSVAPLVPHGDPEAVAPLLTLGDADAVLTVVLACDIALEACRQRLWQLQRWQQTEVPPLVDADGESWQKRRLVFLTWPEGAASTPLALSVHALQLQAQFWPLVPKMAAVVGAWSTDKPLERLLPTGVDVPGLQRTRADADTLDAVQLDRNIAESLQIPPQSGLLIAGLAWDPTECTAAALATRLAEVEAALLAAVAEADGDVRTAQLAVLGAQPTRRRQRYVHWLLDGRKLHSFARPAPAAATASDGEPGAEESPDEPPDDEPPEDGPAAEPDEEPADD